MPSLEQDSGPCDPRIVGVYAVNLISQVMDEAYILANAAEESGHPKQYLTMVKNLRLNKSVGFQNENLLFMTSEYAHKDGKEVDADTITTSTPQKNSESSEHLHASRRQNDVSYFGQGDEGFDVHQDDLNESTSILINHLFDMSEVERVVICDDMEITQTAPSDLLTKAMTNIMETYVNIALNISDEAERSYEHNSNVINVNDSASSTFSLTHVSGSIPIDEVKDDTLVQNNTIVIPELNLQFSGKINTVEDMKSNDSNGDQVIENNALYENTYLTLNRDFDQLYEEDDYPVLQDPKEMALDEVDLKTTVDAEDNELVEEKRGQFTTFSAVTVPASSSRKTSLVRRCRLQGARLLSCIRGWWRRKTPGNRKKVQVSGSIRGFCPLSPQARFRAASMLDNRSPRSPSATRAIMWKFNTVNETLVKSSHWKDYTFEKHEECNEISEC